MRRGILIFGFFLLTLGVFTSTSQATFFIDNSALIENSPGRWCGADFDDGRSEEGFAICVDFYRAVIQRVVFDPYILSSTRLRVLDYVLGDRPSLFVFTRGAEDLGAFLGPIIQDPTSLVEGQNPDL